MIGLTLNLLSVSKSSFYLAGYRLIWGVNCSGLSNLLLIFGNDLAIARFGSFRSPDPTVFLSSYFYSK